MASVIGAVLLGRSLKAMGVDTVFFLMGGPMREVVRECWNQGIKLIDVRHEQAAAMMAHAYSRVSGKPGVCLTGAGADTMNLTTGLANAYLDCCPMVAVCGSASLAIREKGGFQELNQLDVMKPITKRAWQIPVAERIPSFVHMAFSHAVKNRPGPTYIELPADVLIQNVDEAAVELPKALVDCQRPSAPTELVKKAVDSLADARRPLVIFGSGILWSHASTELQEFVNLTSIPFYATPLARGAVPEDHPLSFPGARSAAWREADVILVVGTRTNFIIQYLLPPRFASDVKIINVNIDAEEIDHNRSAYVGIVGDAKLVLKQMIEQAGAAFSSQKFFPWIERLRKADAERAEKTSHLLNSNQSPIHPLRLCKEIGEVLPKDAVLAVDGQEILNFARQTIPTHHVGHRLNPGPSGCIGTGVPFGIGAKAAKPDKTVVVLTGDGSFGMNGMEIDTAVRNKLPIVVVVSNNGGWTSTTRWPTGRNLGFTRYDKLAEALGAWSEFVEKPEEIRPALERALAAGKPALVNVITDPAAQAETQQFADVMHL